ncbi:MAG: hypothetical protein DRR00_29785 [Candidatus Parabeggiatoa sp. nov. 3]|nr:MAG: hypothetical protein DRR00_29785 [Gammaproteobacteria bacterium]RKZ56599.1 MAG: hypothetical protein DRQ99_28250 [Gammaproteobacteria bacterium]
MTEKNKPSHTKDSATTTDSHIDDLLETRRQALKKMGKYSAYTAPAVISLLTAKTVMAQSGSS